MYIIIVQRPNCHQRLVGVDDVGDLVASNFHRWWLGLFHILETGRKISNSQILEHMFMQIFWLSEAVFGYIWESITSHHVFSL